MCVRVVGVAVRGGGGRKREEEGKKGKREGRKFMQKGHLHERSRNADAPPATPRASGPSRHDCMEDARENPKSVS